MRMVISTIIHFRGTRAQWYHSYGLDIALGYVYIANLWGAEVPEKLSNKLVNPTQLPDPGNN